METQERVVKMIIEKILDLWFSAIDLLLNMLPVNVVETVSTLNPPHFINWALCFFPTDVITVVIAMFGTSYIVMMAWAVIEWVYKKIPGVS